MKQNRRSDPQGNANALRPEFYYRQFKTIIQTNLDGHKFTGLTDEITALCVFICQIMELIGQPGVAQQALAVDFFSLSRLVRAHHIISLAGDADNFLLDRDVNEVLAELKAEGP
jgi:hypothetical protein